MQQLPAVVHGVHRNPPSSHHGLIHLVNVCLVAIYAQVARVEISSQGTVHRRLLDSTVTPPAKAAVSEVLVKPSSTQQQQQQTQHKQKQDMPAGNTADGAAAKWLPPRERHAVGATAEPVISTTDQAPKQSSSNDSTKPADTKPAQADSKTPSTSPAAAPAADKPATVNPGNAVAQQPAHAGSQTSGNSITAPAADKTPKQDGSTATSSGSNGSEPKSSSKPVAATVPKADSSSKAPAAAPEVDKLKAALKDNVSAAPVADTMPKQAVTAPPATPVPPQAGKPTGADRVPAAAEVPKTQPKTAASSDMSKAAPADKPAPAAVPAPTPMQASTPAPADARTSEDGSSSSNNDALPAHSADLDYMEVTDNHKSEAAAHAELAAAAAAEAAVAVASGGEAQVQGAPAPGPVAQGAAGTFTAQPAPAAAPTAGAAGSSDTSNAADPTNSNFRLLFPSHLASKPAVPKPWQQRTTAAVKQAAGPAAAGQKPGAPLRPTATKPMAAVIHRGVGMPALGATGRPSSLFPVSGGAQQQSDFSLLATSQGPAAASSGPATSSPKASTPPPPAAPSTGASKPAAAKKEQQQAAVTDATHTGADGYVVDDDIFAAYPVFADPASVAEAFADTQESEWQSLKPADAAAEDSTVFASGFRFVDPDPNHLYDPVPEDEGLEPAAAQQESYAGGRHYHGRSYEPEEELSRYTPPEPELEYSESEYSAPEYKQYSYEPEEDDNVMQVSSTTHQAVTKLHARG